MKNPIMVVYDVGDGMHCKINNECLCIDCGGNKNLNFNWIVDRFMLSHFHADHYNGLLQADYIKGKHPILKFGIRAFYFPIMPKFEEKNTFYKCLLAMNMRLNPYHPLQNSIFGIVKALNRNLPISFIPLSKGEVFSCCNSKYEILWPPKEISDVKILKVIKNAINTFEEAMKVDPKLTSIYKHLRKIDVNEEPIFEYNDNNENNNLMLEQAIISEKVEEANKSLRKAANRLSLAFRQEDNILFLGDLEKKEIKCIVDELEQRKETYYDIIVAAHHGTHWDDSLNNLRCSLAIASIGKNLKRYVKNEYKGICDRFILTENWGDIRINKFIELQIEK